MNLMKFKGNQNEIFDVLKKCKGVLCKHAIQPVLACYKIEVSDDNIKITATDLESQISGTCSAIVEEKGTFCIGGTKFTEVISKLSGVIDFEVENNMLVIKNGRTKYKMMIVDGNEYPKDMTDFEYKSTELPKDFVKKVRQVLFCTQDLSARSVLNGVLFANNDCKLNLVTTDGNRLSIADTITEISDSCNVVLPQKILFELAKTEYENIFLALGGNRVMFIADNMMFVSRILDGQFPRYEGLIPKSFVNVVNVNALDFKQALNRTCVMIEDNNQRVEFKINSHSFRMTASSKDFGKSSDCIDVTSNIDEEKTLYFNSKYIYDFLNATKEETIKIGINNELGAVMFMADFNYLLMPMIK